MGWGDHGLGVHGLEEQWAGGTTGWGDHGLGGRWPGGTTGWGDHGLGGPWAGGSGQQGWAEPPAFRTETHRSCDVHSLHLFLSF